MHVLHVYKSYYPEDKTGVARVIHTLSEEMANLGVDSHVIATYVNPYSTPETLNNHHVHAVQRDFHFASTSFSTSIFASFRKAVVLADLVHYHFPWPVADLLCLLHGRNKPAIVTYHSDIVKQRALRHLYAPIMHRFLRNADVLVATSPGYARTSPTLVRYHKKVSVIPIGIEDRTPPAPQDLQRWRARTGEGFFLFVGSLRYYKGLGYLIEAARRTRLPVVIAGEGNLANLGIDNVPPNVMLVGSIADEEKEALLSLAGAFVFPSHLRSEAFGIALLEAARAGKPLISCEMGTGTSFINIANETGLVIPPADSGRLADAMMTMSRQPVLAAEMGLRARARYEQYFQATVMADAYLQLYRRCLS